MIYIYIRTTWQEARQVRHKSYSNSSEYHSYSDETVSVDIESFEIDKQGEIPKNL
jgi:hypothetical protein